VIPRFLDGQRRRLQMRNGYFEFLTFFVDLSDPRQDRGHNHRLLDMVGLTLCGTIAGANSWADIERFACAHQDWFEEFLELPYGVPSHDTFSRVFARLETEEFQQCLARWVEHLQLQLAGETVAIDGKTLRGSHDRSAGLEALHVVNAWANHVNFCLGQVSVDSKANEIPAVRELLDILNLKGAVVTADAMHCQKATAKKIVEKGADYVLQVKENQPSLCRAIADEFDRYGEANYTDRRLRQCTTKEQNRGRHETRTCLVAPAPAALKRLWPGLLTIGLMHRIRELPDGTQSAELSYFISSLPPKVRDHARHLRNHWRVENTLHHTLDVTFTEDASRIRKGSGSEITAAFRRLALSILKSDTTVKDNIRGKRLTAGWDLNKMKSILLAFQAA
jgi:predicted transposase YbfD/YdcC